MIQRLGFQGFFLIVHGLVEFARGRGILCQGRGSAANSAVYYCLGITSCDPVAGGLLFERFLSAYRKSWPDIDIPFPPTVSRRPTRKGLRNRTPGKGILRQEGVRQTITRCHLPKRRCLLPDTSAAFVLAR